MGTTAPQDVLTALTSGWKWGDPAANGEPVTLLFTFLTNLPSYYGSPGDPQYRAGFDSVNTAQETAIRASLVYWSSVANVTFQETTSADAAHMTFGRYAIPNLPNGDVVAGAGSYPGSYPSDGDVWLNVNSAIMAAPAAGSEGFGVITHELGHALGLQHPFDIGTASNDFYTVMSYTIHDPAGATWSYKPMLWDIAAIQYLYGANLAAAAGNTDYTWTDGTTRFETIWDATGNDTIDATATTTANLIDLEPGASSSIGRGDWVENLSPVSSTASSKMRAAVRAQTRSEGIQPVTS
jgi:serralysin